MKGPQKLILCQPDSVKGCSVCCGLFNMRDTSRSNLSEFLKDGLMREKLCRTFEEYEEPAEVRDRFSHICPYQGFLSAGKPGCLIHPLSAGSEGRDRSLFASSVCGGFLCPAHDILDDEEKGALIKYVEDWYLYSTGIADPESFSCIYEYAKRISTPEKMAPLLTAGLKAHAANLLSFDGIMFFYSVPEYNINRRHFSLRFRGDFLSEVVKSMDKCHAGRD